MLEFGFYLFTVPVRYQDGNGFIRLADGIMKILNSVPDGQDNSDVKSSYRLCTRCSFALFMFRRPRIFMVRVI